MALDGESSKNMLSNSIGSHTVSPYIVCEEELTMMPMKLTTENPRGTEISCGRTAAAGVFAREAKSGALLQGLSEDIHQAGRRITHVIRVAMLEMQDMRLNTIAQLRSEPWI